MIKRFMQWNKWRKGNLNNIYYQILVLLNIVHSPTFDIFKKFYSYAYDKRTVKIKNKD